MHTLLHSGPPTLQQATTDPHHQPTPLPETLSPSGASLGQSRVGSLLLSPGSWWLKVLFVPSKSLFPQSCVSSGGSLVGLMVTSYKGAYAIPRSTAVRASDPAAVHCWPVPPQETLKHSSVSVSVGSLGPGAHKVCLSPLSISGGHAVWFQTWFCPSYHLAEASSLPLDAGFLLKVSPVPCSHHRLPSFWGFSALGCGIYMSVYTFKASQVAVVVKKLPANTGDVRNAGLILESRRSPGGGHGNPFQCSYLTNLMEGAALWATDHRDAKSQTRLKQLSTHAYTFNIWYRWMYTDIYLFYLNAIILFRGPYLIRWFQVYFVKVYTDDPPIYIIFQLQIFSSIFGSGMLTEICN